MSRIIEANYNKFQAFYEGFNTVIWESLAYVFFSWCVVLQDETQDKG